MGTKMAPSYANIFMGKIGMLLVTWGGWQLLGKRYWLVSVDLEYKSVDKELEVSRKEMVVLDIAWVNLIEGCNLKIIWKEGITNKVLSRKILTKLITSPGAAYFSTKKNRNVKEP
jgi:hypothetical protein